MEIGPLSGSLFPAKEDPRNKTFFSKWIKSVFVRNRLQRNESHQHRELRAGRHAGQPGQPLLRRGAQPARGVPTAARARAHGARQGRVAVPAAARRGPARCVADLSHLLAI